jgi:hypothetical protein
MLCIMVWDIVPRYGHVPVFPAQVAEFSGVGVSGDSVLLHQL